MKHRHNGSSWTARVAAALILAGSLSSCTYVWQTTYDSSGRVTSFGHWQTSDTTPRVTRGWF